MKRYFLLLLIIISFSSKAQLIKDTATISSMNRMFLKTKELAKNRNDVLFAVFNKQITADEKQALTFLYAYMPLSDLADYSGQFFLDNVKLALKAKNEMSWGKNIPEDVFLHFVLPVRVNNENLDSFRIVMYDELKKRVSGLSMKEAALEVNHWCHEKVTYKASDDRTSSPLNTIKYSLGRCGEESTFTVSAMRMVGIPARQVYTPRWAHTDDNHAWVEVWVDNKWYFLGACEPESDLNMGWFANPAARAMLVHTRAYGAYFGIEPVIDREDRFAELNLISNYAPTKYFVVKVTDSLGKSVSNAKVEYQLYNYAEYYPIAKNYTNTFGITGLTSGLGDLIIWANKGDAYGYKKITVESVDTVTIQLLKSHPVEASETFDINPPVERSVAVASKAGVAENSKRLKAEDSLRTIYMRTFKDSAWVINFAAKNKINKDSALSFILKSFGNWKEITSFIENTPVEKRGWAMKLLSVISDKDLRDTRASILRDHLNNAFRYDKGLATMNPELFTKYVLSCRIDNEMMIGWRSFLQDKFDTAFARKAKKNITVITKWITDNISIDNSSNLHSRAPLTPVGVYNLKVADNTSRDIFFIALCRSLNIPAGLNPETREPEYWAGTEWMEMNPSDERNVNVMKGYFHLTNPSANFEPKYTLNFTIAKYKDGVYRTLEYEESKMLKDFPEKIEVDPGKYILVTGNRMSDGSVLSYMHFFNVEEGKTTNVKVIVREKAMDEKPLGTLDTSGVVLKDLNNNKSYRLSELVKTKGTVIIFIDPEKEPSKHVLVDIAAVKESFEKWGGSMIFIIPAKSKSSSLNASNFTGLPKQSLFVADSKTDDFIININNQKGCSNVDKFPVILYADKTCKLYYYSEGYRIGAGEQLLKVIGKMKVEIGK